MPMFFAQCEEKQARCLRAVQGCRAVGPWSGASAFSQLYLRMPVMIR